MDTKIVRVLELEYELIEYLCKQSEMKLEHFNEKFFSDEKSVLLVAYENETPSGFLWGYQLECFHSDRPLMFLYSIDIFEGYKRRGVGRRLIEKLKEVADENNCSEIFVFTNESNSAAKGLYEKIGAVRENLDDVMYVYKVENL